MTNIILVDDHQIILDTLKYTINSVDGLQVIATKNCPAEALKYISTNGGKLDVAIIDIKMKTIDGIQLVQRVRQFNSDLKILMLSQYNHELYINKSIERGANGYLYKNVSKDDLLDAISQVLAGEMYICKDASRTLIKSSLNKDAKAKLTRRESQILVEICNGLTNNIIAKKIKISTATVSFHRRNLMSKLNINNSVELTKYAIRAGYADATH